MPHTWTTDLPLTLVGDAARLMSPFAGRGANLAMLDGAELGERIACAVLAGDDVTDALRAYEASMLPRAADAQAQSERGIDIAIAPDAPGAAVAFFTQH